MVDQETAKESIDKISTKSQEFFEFVLPPIDMHLENENLIVTIDLPGFKKEEIKTSIHGNILSINAEKKETSNTKNEIISKQRPNVIDKKIRLPLKIKEGEEPVSSAEYLEGVLVIKIPSNTKGNQFSIDK